MYILKYDLHVFRISVNSIKFIQYSAHMFACVWSQCFLCRDPITYLRSSESLFSTLQCIPHFLSQHFLHIHKAPFSAGNTLTALRCRHDEVVTQSSATQFSLSCLLWADFCPPTPALPTHNSYVEALTPNVPIFGDRVFKELIKMN